jgi:hypothetical protein
MKPEIYYGSKEISPLVPILGQTYQIIHPIGTSFKIHLYSDITSSLFLQMFLSKFCTYL